MQVLLTWVTASIGGIPGWIAGILLNFFWSKATDAIAKEVKQSSDDKAIDDQKAAAVKEEENAKTKAELDAADDDLMREL